MISNIGEGATPLMYACQQSREREVLDLIARKRNSVRERDRTLKTPLHYCTENSSTGCAEAVLRAAPELLDSKDEDGYTALHLAVIAGNKTFLRFLISRGANVNASDNERHSAVHWATVCGEEEALDIIIRAGADISTADIHGGYPLHYAAQMCGPGGEMGRDPKIGLRILNILLSHNIDINVKDKDGRQPILWAASAGSADAILALVKAGASVEASDKDGLTALHCAASRGHTDCIETLVTLCGAHIDVIDTNGCTALFYAVTLGHADSTQLLLSLGAEPNRQDRKGRTPAHCGAAKGQLETLRILLNYGANLWLRNVKGDFPLHEAVASGRRELVRWLLNQRLDSINVGNNDGRCPIHIAAINNNIDMLKILLDAQSLVNPIMRTTKGELMTPLDAALYRGFRGCAKYLQLHGGVPFTKLTEKSCNIRGISSTHINSEIPPENYDQMWGMVQNSSTSFLPIQIKMGGDKAIQQIETSDLRAVTRIPEGFEDIRSSDEERMHRRRRRRKKWEYQRKSYISEEDSNLEEEEYQRSVEDGQGKHYEEWSSDEVYKKKTNKKDYADESYETMERAYYSATEDSENERNRERKRRARRKESQRGRARSEHTRRDVSGRKSVSRLTVAEVHESPGNFSDGGKTDKAIPVSVRSGDDKRRDVVQAKKKGSDVALEGKVLDEESHPTITVLDDDEETNKNETEVTESFIETKNSIQLESLPDLSHEMVYLQNSPYNESKEVEEVENEKKNVEESFTNEIKAEVTELMERKLEGEAATRAVEKEEEAEEKEENKEKEEAEENIENEEKGENEDKEEEKEKNEVKGEQEESEEKEENGKQGENGEKGKEEEGEEKDDNGEEEETVEKEADGQREAEEEEKEEIEEKEETENAENIAIGDPEPQEEEDEEIIGDDIANAPEENQPEADQILTEDINDRTDGEEPEGKENLLTELISDQEEHQEEEEQEVEDEEDEQGEVEEGIDKTEERNEYIPSAFEVLDSGASEKLPFSRTSSRNNFDGNSSRRGSVSGGIENRPGDPDGSIGEESGGSVRNEDSSALMDSGIEPSPRRTVRDQKGPNPGTIRTRVPRLCNKGKEPEEIHTVSVTQTVQNTIRKYHVERKIFYQLLELKRLQIRAGRANEQVLVKRLVDEYRRGGIIPGLQNYSGPFTFTQFEKFLYDQLRTLQSTARILIPKLRPSDDIETLSTILRKSRVELVDDIPENPMFCTLGTHRCHHATHAYTGIPCAAYITKFNHHEMPKTRSGGFLPQIDQTYTERSAGQQTSYRPVTLEVSHGKEKQVISLPTDRLDKNKRYYVTFTIKGGPSLEESKSGPEERMLRHRHAKSF